MKNLREELIKYRRWEDGLDPSKDIDVFDNIETLVDRYLSIQPNGGDRVVNENEPQKEVCKHNMVPFGSDELDAGYYCTKCNYLI